MAVEIKEEEWQELIETVKKHKEQIDGLQEQIGSTNNLLGYALREVKELKDLLIGKEDNKRRDYDILIGKVRKALEKMPHALTVRDIRFLCDMNHHELASRLMDKTIAKFPTEVKLHRDGGKKKGKKRIVLIHAH